MYEEYVPTERRSRRVVREVFDWVEAAMLAVVCVVLTFTFVVRMAGVDGESMLPTLEDNDRLLITRLGGSPAEGDIVVITQPNRMKEPLIKRVIAVGGQLIEIDSETGEVRVDGRRKPETYILDPQGKTTLVGGGALQLHVPMGHIFVMGDNRDNSWDSRSNEIGTVDSRYVLGRAVYRVSPYEKLGQPGK